MIQITPRVKVKSTIEPVKQLLVLLEDVKIATMAAPVAVQGTAATALRSVLHRVRQAAERSGRVADQIRVVAVSKTKPISLIREVYDAGHRCFGENYVQEFIDKAPQVPILFTRKVFIFVCHVWIRV